MVDSRGGRDSKLVYVVPHLSATEAEHFAHVPALLAALGDRVNVAAVVERGNPPDRLPGVRLLLSVPEQGQFGKGQFGKGRIGRTLGTLRAIRRCARAGYRTYFLRYSKLFLILLIITRPVYRHRIMLWRSGLPDVLEPGRRKTIRQRLDDAINRATARGVHQLVTGPETMVDYMSRRWGVPRHRMRLLYNDVDPDRFAPLEPAARRAARERLGWACDEFVLLFVHRLCYRKGASLLAPLIDAVSDAGAADRPPRVRLVVAGDGPDRARLERQAADPERAGRMRLLGAVPNRDLPELYAAADCVVMPSFEEGFPRVLVEAMATATPVVTTDAGGVPEMITHQYNGLLVPCDDEDKLYEVLIELVQNSNMRKTLQRNDRQTIREKFSEDIMLDKLEAFFRQTIQQYKFS